MNFRIITRSYALILGENFPGNQKERVLQLFSVFLHIMKSIKKCITKNFTLNGDYSHVHQKMILNEDEQYIKLIRLIKFYKLSFKNRTKGG